MPFEKPTILNTVSDRINKTVNESTLPTKNYESTVGIYGGKLVEDEQGRMVFDMRGLISKIDQLGDAFLRTYDDHLMKDLFAMLKKHPKWFLKFVFTPGTKRFRGNPEQILQNIKRLGLTDVYDACPEGIEIKDKSIFTDGLALQDIYRADLIDNESLLEIDRFQALASAAKYLQQIHEHGGVGEMLVSDIIFQDTRDVAGKTEVVKPILNIPDIVFNEEKNLPERSKQAIDLLDFLVNVGVEEMRRSESDEQSVERAMKLILDNYQNSEVVATVLSFVKSGYLTLQGDKAVKEIGLPEKVLQKARGVFSKHNEARMGNSNQDIEAFLKKTVLEVGADYLQNNQEKA